MSLRRVHWRDVTKAFRNLERAGTPKPYSKYQLTKEVASVTGISLDPKNTDDWNRDIYSNGIMFMRNSILSTFLISQFGDADPETIIRDKLQTTPEFDAAMAQITDTMRLPYNPMSEYYVRDKARGIKRVMDQLRPWELSREDAIALMLRLQNLNYLWEDCLLNCEKINGMIFLSAKFTRGAGYDIPAYMQVLGNLESFVKARSKQILRSLVQYVALGGVDSTALLEGRKPLRMIESQASVPQLMTNGPVFTKCPMGCGATFAIEADLITHLMATHGAR